MTKAFENAVKKVKPEGTFASSIIPSQYDIGYQDMSGLMEMARSGLDFEALAMAFDFGFVMGNRCTHSRKMKRL